jgi:hypothetical protein
MAKPSTKKAATRRKKPARKVAPKPVTRAPETVEELKQEIAKFDHDGDGHMGGSLPHPAEGADAAEPAAEVEGETKKRPASRKPSQSRPKRPHRLPKQTPVLRSVMLGSVECRLRRIPVETVLGLLSPEGLRRIEAHKETASFESTRQRLLATDGRATPVIFEAPNLAGGDTPTILHGFEEIAAAQVCGVPDVSVILVPAGGASEAQSHIVEMVRQQRMQGQTSDDDELFYRVHAEG